MKVPAMMIIACIVLTGCGRYYRSDDGTLFRTKGATSAMLGAIVKKVDYDKTVFKKRFVETTIDPEAKPLAIKEVEGKITFRKEWKKAFKGKGKVEGKVTPPGDAATSGTLSLQAEGDLKVEREVGESATDVTIDLYDTAGFRSKLNEDSNEAIKFRQTLAGDKKYRIVMGVVAREGYQW